MPPVLTIAGSDCSAGAGAQADLKTFSALGTYGLTAITCVVSEVPGCVSEIQPVSTRIVLDQIRLLFDCFPIGAFKTGMLHSREIIEAISGILGAQFPDWKNAPPLVVDPVMIATSGDPLLEPDAIEAYKNRLFPLATLITPNLDEVQALLRQPVTSLEEMRAAGTELVARFGTAFLLKGGHLRGTDATDLLFADGEIVEFSAPFVPGVSTHGTGCTYSAAIVAGLGRGLPLREAVGEAKRYVSRAIGGYLRWEKGDHTIDALNHFAP